MTRINCVPVTELHYKHLVAEYRELPRVFGLARYTTKAPKEYTLGKGHVLFFYNKLCWLYHRQCELCYEMKRRGYKPTYNPDDLFSMYYNTKQHLWGDWLPTEEAMRINRERLAERMPNG